MMIAKNEAGKAALVTLVLVGAAAAGWWAWRRMAEPHAQPSSQPGTVAGVELRGKSLRSAPEDKSKLASKTGGDSKPAAPVPPRTTGSNETEWTALDVADLSNFDYEESGEEIPPEIQAWNGKQVQIHGYMNPTRFTKEGVAEFMLTAFPGACCFASIPRLNEWVVVRMPEGQSTDYAYYAPIAVQGVLEVGEEVVDDVVQSLFRLEARLVAIED